MPDRWYCGTDRPPGGSVRVADRSPAHRLARWGGLVLRRVHPGWARTSAMVLPYAETWSAANEAARAAEGRLWVVLGDSTAQAVGASSHRRGYVGGLLAWLGERTGETWRVVNLSRSGARAADVLAEQLPALEALGDGPELVTLAVGANDMVRRTPLARLEATLTAVLDRLPAGSVVATLPQGLGRGRPTAVNRLLTRLADERGLTLADLWSHTGPPWAGKFAGDGFHPNDDGYRDWVAAFTAALAGRW
ncbi:MAG: SGNH/GDSL hydrolase family protein [Acidimicrobiales bacterium]